KHLESQILRSLFQSHPYEEVAYEITTLENVNQKIGMGMVGELEEEMSPEAFFDHLKEIMKVSVVRHSEICKEKIRKVAVLGGSGSFAIEAARRAGADVFVSADFKY